MVMDEAVAIRQDIRPLRIILLNLMPKKIQTETQFARLIGATPLQIEFHLMRMTEHRSKNTPADHLAAFYRTFRCPFACLFLGQAGGLIHGGTDFLVKQDAPAAQPGGRP